MVDKKTGRFTFRTTKEDERILSFIIAVDGEDGSKIIRRLITKYGIQKGYLSTKYNIDPVVSYDR